jgi:hypothetical protein
MATKNYFVFCLLLLLHSSKIKSHKEVTKRRNQGFSYYFCFMIEGSGSGSRSGSATLLLIIIYDTLKSVFLVNSSLGLMGVVLTPPQSLLSLARQFFSLINAATSGLSSEVGNKFQM